MDIGRYFSETLECYKKQPLELIVGGLLALLVGSVSAGILAGPAYAGFALMLKRIRDGGKLCQVFVSPEGARTIVQNLGGNGFLLMIGHANPEFADEEKAQAFLDLLAQEDISLH